MTTPEVKDPAASTPSAEERKKRIAELQARFNSVPKMAGAGSTAPTAAADAPKIVATIAEAIGTDRSFLIRDLTDDIKFKLRDGFGITTDEHTSQHQLSQALAMAMRRAKETPVVHNKETLVLMNQPGEGTRPSQWCVFKT